MGVSVVMDPVGAPVVPGQRATTNIRIRNTGAVVDQFVLDVVGEAATWSHVEPSSVNLLPGEEQVAQVVFEPPRSTRLPEGPAAYALRVMSREDTAGSAVHEAVVDIAPYSQVVGELLPRTSTGRRSGRHQLALDNLGNHPELISVTASDPDLKLRFDLDPVNVTIDPGTATFVKVRVKPKRTFVKGPNQSIPFQVAAASTETEPLVLPGAMVQTSILPPWIFKALALAVIAAIALVALWYTVLRPTVQSTAEAAAEDHTKELADAIKSATDQANQAQEDAASAQDDATEAKKDAKQADQTSTKADGKITKIAKARGVTTFDDTKAVDYRVPTDAPAGGTGRDQVDLPAKKVTWISDIILQNPRGNTGTLRIQRGDNVLLTFGLENFRDLDYHFIQPAQFTKENPIVVTVDCGSDTGRCTPSVYFSGQSANPKPVRQ
jgi:hypothetical protein